MNVQKATSLAADLAALETLKRELASPLNELRDFLVEQAQLFSSEPLRSHWLLKSRFCVLRYSGSIRNGDYKLWAAKGNFVFEAKDSWGSWDQCSLSPAEAANFAEHLESEYQKSLL